MSNQEIKQLSKVSALKIYNQLDAKGKKLLEAEFGKDFFYEPNITDRIKSYEDACKEKGYDPIAELPYKDPITKRQKVANAHIMLDIIAEALQDGFIGDYNNVSQHKWFPVFKVTGSGFGFSDSGYDGWNSGTLVGSRLCFPKEAVSDYFGKQFIDLHNEILTK